jgi:hypothetical protein
MASKKGALLTRESILAAEDVQVEDVDVPEWGGVVRVRGLTGMQRDAFESEIVVQNGKNTERNTHNLRARLIALAVVDEAGARMFTHHDVDALGAKSARALDRVFEAASRLSGLSAGDVDELAENFVEGQSDGSISV